MCVDAALMRHPIKKINLKKKTGRRQILRRRREDLEGETGRGERTGLKDERTNRSKSLG